MTPELLQTVQDTRKRFETSTDDEVLFFLASYTQRRIDAERYQALRALCEAGNYLPFARQISNRYNGEVLRDFDLLFDSVVKEVSP